MNPTSMYVAVACYFVAMTVVVWLFVREAAKAEKKVERLQGRLAMAYRHSGQLEQMLEDKREQNKRLAARLAERANPLATLNEEPPVGTIVAVNGHVPWIRNGADAAPWSSWAAESDLSWDLLWSSDLKILRWGWEQ